ncbi:MAG: hypothetical protein PVF82_10505 [Gammaproteobacteria bacterium]|jgi:hypothetical protein
MNIGQRYKKTIDSQIVILPGTDAGLLHTSKRDRGKNYCFYGKK